MCEALTTAAEATDKGSLASVGAEVVEKVMPFLGNLLTAFKLTDHEVIYPICLSVTELVVNKLAIHRNILTLDDLLGPA